MWFVFLAVIGLFGWLLWRSIDRVPEKHEAHGGVVFADSVPRVPKRKLPVVTAEMFTPHAELLTMERACEAYTRFMQHIGWGDSADVFHFQTSMEAQRDEFVGRIARIDELLEEVAGELDEVEGMLGEHADASDPDEKLDADDLADCRQERRKLRAERGKLKSMRARTADQLAEFDRDLRPYLVAHLNHEIHGRKSPLKEFDFLDR